MPSEVAFSKASQTRIHLERRFFHRKTSYIDFHRLKTPPSIPRSFIHPFFFTLPFSLKPLSASQGSAKPSHPRAFAVNLRQPHHVRQNLPVTSHHRSHRSWQNDCPIASETCQTITQRGPD
jgi:hypothetical protein